MCVNWGFSVSSWIQTRRHQQQQEIEAAILIQHQYRRYKEVRNTPFLFVSVSRIISNYSPKWRWSGYLPSRWRGEVNVCHSSPTLRCAIVLVYAKPLDSQHQIVLFWRNEGKLVPEFQKNAGRWTEDTIPSLSSQSERAKNTIHWFGIH